MLLLLLSKQLLLLNLRCKELLLLSLRLKPLGALTATRRITECAMLLLSSWCELLLLVSQLLLLLGLMHKSLTWCEGLLLNLQGGLSFQFLLALQTGLRDQLERLSWLKQRLLHLLQRLLLCLLQGLEYLLSWLSTAYLLLELRLQQSLLLLELLCIAPHLLLLIDLVLELLLQFLLEQLNHLI